MDGLTDVPRIMEGDTPPTDGSAYITVTDPKDLKPDTIEDRTDAHLERIAKGVILGTENYQKTRKIKSELEQRVIKKIGTKGKLITDKLFELIEGVYIEESYKGGKRRIYKSPPNLAAIKIALETVIGKPVAKTEHTEEKRGLFTVEHIIKGLATKGYGDKKPVRGTAREKAEGN